jgi:hypothetical protein
MIGYPETVRLHESSMRTQHSTALGASVLLLLLTFLLPMERPYRLDGDVGYQAFSARQYAKGETPHFYSVRFADPRDLSRNIVTPLTTWPPGWSAIFVPAFSAGLAPGKAARLLALLVACIGLFGWWRIGIALKLPDWPLLLSLCLAAMYPLRSGANEEMVGGDLLVFALLPWLLLTALRISQREEAPRWPVLLLWSFCAGAIYWFKYSGILPAIGLWLFLMLHAWSIMRRQPTRWLLLAVASGLCLIAPVLALKQWNTGRAGADLLEAASASLRPELSIARFLSLCEETLRNASGTLFSAGLFTERITPRLPGALGWMLRLPGLLLMPCLVYAVFRHYGWRMAAMASAIIAVPLAAFPMLTFVSGLPFPSDATRYTLPFWIFLEMLCLGLLWQAGSSKLLRLLVVVQALCFSYTPLNAMREAWAVHRQPRYEASAASLYAPHLSTQGVVDIHRQLTSLRRSPEDIIVPLNYWLGMDGWLEFGGRLLPLTNFDLPLMATHQRIGASYLASEPFHSSRPLRVMLVATDPYRRNDFIAIRDRAMARFPAAQWQQVSVGRAPQTEIWYADVAAR